MSALNPAGVWGWERSEKTGIGKRERFNKHNVDDRKHASAFQATMLESQKQQADGMCIGPNLPNGEQGTGELAHPTAMPRAVRA